MLPRHPRDIFDECPNCICISSPCALRPSDKSAFPLCVLCFRLINLHVHSVWPAPACEICISSPCGLLPPDKVAFPLCVSCFRLLKKSACPLRVAFLPSAESAFPLLVPCFRLRDLHVLSVWPCFRLLNLHFLSLCLASACTRLKSHIIRRHNSNADAPSSPEGRRIRKIDIVDECPSSRAHRLSFVINVSATAPTASRFL